MLKKIFLGLAFGIMGSLSLAQQAQAASSPTQADFEVQPVMPSGQVNTMLNYFDVVFKPGTTHTIQMRVQNFTNHKITVKTNLVNGVTQIGGGMDFQESTKGLDSSLKVPLTTIASVKKAHRVVHLAAQEATVIDAVVKMPQENHRGIIYGGWHFIEYRNDKAAHKQSVSSNYAYNVGIALRGSQYKVYPELKYDSAKPILYSSEPAMGIKLRNTQPMALKKVHFKAVLSKQGLFSDKRIYDKVNSSMAPNSSVTLPITWNYDTMKPGTYHVDVKVTGENLWNKLPMSWTFRKTFKITKDQTDKINEKAVKKPVNKWFYIATASGVALLMSLAGLYRLFRIGR